MNCSGRYSNPVLKVFFELFSLGTLRPCLGLRVDRIPFWSNVKNFALRFLSNLKARYNNTPSRAWHLFPQKIHGLGRCSYKFEGRTGQCAGRPLNRSMAPTATRFPGSPLSPPGFRQQARLSRKQRPVFWGTLVW